MKFFIGIDTIPQAQHFDRVMMTITRLARRKSDFKANDWILDSAAFTRITSGLGHMPVEDYAKWIERWKDCGNLVAAVCQDYMCEDIALKATGLSITDHQALTIHNYQRLSEMAPEVYIMPVLQGYQPDDYLRHIKLYGDILEEGAWVGVGSVCKRNGSPAEVEIVLSKIKNCRPDLRLHGFGIKTTALRFATIKDMLFSADSMAWNYAARKQGRNNHSIDEAKRFSRKIETQHTQERLWR